eukprot:scaffold36721_cov18-Tisochrysis_lutea.AAC.1
MRCLLVAVERACSSNSIPSGSFQAEAVDASKWSVIQARPSSLLKIKAVYGNLQSWPLEQEQCRQWQPWL